MPARALPSSEFASWWHRSPCSGRFGRPTQEIGPLHGDYVMGTMSWGLLDPCMGTRLDPCMGTPAWGLCHGGLCLPYSESRVRADVCMCVGGRTRRRMCTCACTSIPSRIIVGNLYACPPLSLHRQVRRQRQALEAQAAAVLAQQRAEGGGGSLVAGPGGRADARCAVADVCTRQRAPARVMTGDVHRLFAAMHDR